MKLAETLEKCGWTEGFDAFEDIVLGEFTSRFPSWTDETLLFHPTEGSLPLVKAVVGKTGIKGRKGLLEELVLRVLVNNCKNRRERGPREKASA